MHACVDEDGVSPALGESRWDVFPDKCRCSIAVTVLFPLCVLRGDSELGGRDLPVHGAEVGSVGHCITTTTNGTANACRDGTVILIMGERIACVRWLASECGDVSGLAE